MTFQSRVAVWSSGQDQMSVVKRRLSSLLPEISIFLDVDDLLEIGDLELYVEQSGCILIFVSRGYFYSTNCVREAQATTDQKKPVVLLREDNLSKGGITLADSMRECEARPELRDYIFKDRPVTVWMRIQEHQLETLRQIASRVLVTTPQYKGVAPSQLGLHLPGELRLQRLEFPEHLSLCYSAANRGAKEAAEALSARANGIHLTTTRDGIDGGSLSGKTMLLYLNKRTWEPTDDSGTTSLADEVARARAAGIELVMVHEADEAHGGCEFGLFFQTTCGKLPRALRSSPAARTCGPYPCRSLNHMRAPLNPSPKRVQAEGPHRQRHLHAAGRHVVSTPPSRDQRRSHGQGPWCEGSEPPAHCNVASAAPLVAATHPRGRYGHRRGAEVLHSHGGIRLQRG